VTAATPGADTLAISIDVGNLIAALAAAGGGLEPVFVCAPQQAATLRFWSQADFYDVFASLAVPAGTVIAIEKSSFVSGLDASTGPQAADYSTP